MIHALPFNGVDLPQLSSDSCCDFWLHDLRRLVPYVSHVIKSSTTLVQNVERFVQVFLQKVVAESWRCSRCGNLFVGPLNL